MGWNMKMELLTFSLIGILTCYKYWYTVSVEKLWTQNTRTCIIHDVWFLLILSNEEKTNDYENFEKGMIYKCIWKFWKKGVVEKRGEEETKSMPHAPVLKVSQCKLKQKETILKLGNPLKSKSNSPNQKLAWVLPPPPPARALHWTHWGPSDSRLNFLSVYNSKISPYQNL
jgi:hypothetical protein